MVADATLVCHRGAREVTQITRKHTRFGIDRYQDAICNVVGELSDYREYKALRIREMQRREVSDEQAESILLRAFEVGIIGPHAGHQHYSISFF